MSTPAAQITDPTLVDVNVNDLKGLSPEERQALSATTDPQSTVAAYRQQHATEQSAIENIELQRLEAENQRMAAQLGQTSEQLTQLQSGYDNLTGQLTAQQQAAQSQAAQQSAMDQFAWTPEQEETHGDLKDIIRKETQRTKWEIDQEVERRLAVEKQAWQAEATQPIQQKIEELETAQNNAKLQSAAQFNSSLASEIDGLGLGDMDTMLSMPEFNQRYNQAVAPGVQMAWGDLLKQNIENQDLNSTRQMLKDFRDNHTSLEKRDDVEVPAGSGASSSKPLTTEAQTNLDKRKALTKIMRDRQEKANAGVLPPGITTRSQYQAEQRKLKAQIDAIPTT